MLNSAAGVVLPWPMLPPMREMCATLSFRSGCSRRNVAMLVSGPTGTRVTGSVEASSRATASSWPGSTSRITGFGLTLAPLHVAVCWYVSSYEALRTARQRKAPKGAHQAQRESAEAVDGRRVVAVDPRLRGMGEGSH